MFDIKLNLPVKLSLYVGLPSLAIILYYFQRSKKDYEDEFMNCDNMIRSRQTYLEIKVPSDCVRSIIGPGGAIIKEIQQKTECRINFKDKNITSNKDDDNLMVEKTLLIRGSSANVQKAELEIKRLILDNAMQLTEEYLVPDFACGRIIGKGGANIREIQMVSNCRIKLTDKMYNRDSMQLNDLYDTAKLAISNDFRKKITISGSTEQILCAKKLIMQKIKEEEIIREKRMNRENQRNAKYQTASTYSLSSGASNISIYNEMSTNENQYAFKHPDTINLESYLDSNQCIDAYVSAVCSPHAFWVQVIHDNSYKLEELLTEMNSFYNSTCENFTNMSQVKTGELVACKYDKENWHRAKIIEIVNIDGAEKVDVYYVDYGDSHYVDLSRLSKLDQKFCKLAIQSIEVKLDGIVPISGEQWSEEALDFFEDITYSSKWKKLKLQLIKEKSVESKTIVSLYDKNKNKDIAELMIENGFAKSNQETETILKDDSNLKLSINLIN